ncbi:MAG: fimbrillin family protein, partial [Duncaniella sp.]|nr:fimbrillin family protein [Duncaniella sp.]
LVGSERCIRVRPTLAADDPSVRTVIYDNTPVTYINSAWSTPAPQYWYNHHLHSFVTIHPASVLSAGDATPRFSNSQLSFSYTLPSDLSKTADILAATHRRLYADEREYDPDGLLRGHADIVYLRFGHLMSLINLAPALADNVMRPDEYIEFRRLELSGFRTRATFAVAPATLLTSDQTDDRTISVTGHEGSGSLAIDFNPPVKVVNDNRNVTLINSGDPVIMLPQAFPADSDVEFILTYTVNDDPSIKQVTLPLNNQRWESGKSYTYRFTIDRTGLQFGNTAITDWDVYDVGNIDVH